MPPEASSSKTEGAPSGAAGPLRRQETEGLTNESTPDDGTAAPPPAGPPATTRRAFLGGSGRKALYVTPALLTLTAQRAMAGTSGREGFVCGSAFKHTVGSPCATDGSQNDCCPPLTCDMVTDGVCVP